MAYSQQKSYVDHSRNELEFEGRYKVYLEIFPLKGVLRLVKKGMLNPRYVGPYEIFQRVCKVAYELKLPSELASVHSVFDVSMLKKCISDPESIPIEGVGVKANLSYEEVPFKSLLGK